MFFVPIPRAIAKERGLKFYQSNKPCSEGLIAPRRITSGGVCMCLHHLEKANKAKRKKYHENPEKYIIKDPKKIEIRRLKDKERYLNNREVILAKKKQDRLKDPEKYNNRYKQFRKDNIEYSLQRNKAYYSEKREDLLIKAREKRRKNPLIYRDRYKKYYKENKSVVFTNKAKRRILVDNSMTSFWTELDHFVNTEAFSLNALRFKLTGIKWHVDHMIPIKAKNVCGLHVWNNFQCLPAIMNQSKKNKLIYTNPHEWILDIPKFFTVVHQYQQAA